MMNFKILLSNKGILYSITFVWCNLYCCNL